MTSISIFEKFYNMVEAFILRLVPIKGVGPVFKWLFKMPVLQYRIGLGSLIGRHILLLETRGRKSGKLRFTALEYLYDKEGDRYRVFAGWGGRTDWYRNICKNPLVTVQVGTRKFGAVAEVVSDEEVAKYMQYVSSRHPNMDRIWSRWSDKPIDRSWDSYLYAARFFPAVWLRPKTPS